MKTTLGVLATGVALAASVGAGGVHAAEMSLNAASCFPIGSPPSKGYEAMIAEVNKRGKGVLQIKLTGGAPAIGSPFTLTQKMAAGAYDMVGCTDAYFGNVLPEAPVLRLAENSFADLRKNGGMDLLQKLFAAKGIYYVGRHADNGPFHLWLNKPISKPDLTGLHLRVSPVYTAFFTTLGATVQQSNLAQIYTYMENGTVQGYGWPIAGYVPSWAKVTKYRVDPGFYYSPLHTLVNLRKWKALGKPQQELLTKIVAEFEADSDPRGAKMSAEIEKQRKWLAAQGMETIEFKGADREKWSNAARDAGWKEVLDRSPENGAKLKALFVK